MAEINPTPPQLSEQDIQRFWSKVDKTPGQGPQGTCWTWKGFRNKKGYGSFGLYPRGCRAHRIAYMLNTGEWPLILVCHRCDNPPCVRPDHLYAGTSAQNNGEAKAKGRCATGVRHGSRTHPDRTPRGSRCTQSKLTEADVIAMRAMAPALTNRAIAKRFNVSEALVGYIVKRKWWTHI